MKIRAWTRCGSTWTQVRSPFPPGAGTCCGPAGKRSRARFVRGITGLGGRCIPWILPVNRVAFGRACTTSAIRPGKRDLWRRPRDHHPLPWRGAAADFHPGRSQRRPRSPQGHSALSRGLRWRGLLCPGAELDGQSAAGQPERQGAVRWMDAAAFDAFHATMTAMNDALDGCLTRSRTD